MDSNRSEVSERAGSAVEQEAAQIAPANQRRPERRIQP